MVVTKNICAMKELRLALGNVTIGGDASQLVILERLGERDTGVL